VLVDGGSQLLESLLRARQVSGLESLTDSREILLALAELECVPVERAILGHRLDGTVCLLGLGEVAGFKCLAKLSQLRIARLKIGLQSLVNRA
jgi:hypothetical protein